MDWKESWSYFISGLSFLISKIPHTCEELTSFFIMLTVIITFFFITLPRALRAQRCLHKKDEKDEKEEKKCLLK